MRINVAFFSCNIKIGTVAKYFRYQKDWNVSKQVIDIIYIWLTARAVFERIGHFSLRRVNTYSENLR